MGYFSIDEAQNRQIILDHYEFPNHKLKDEDVKKYDRNKAYNAFNNKTASCIDNLTIYIKLENNTIVDAKFSGIGCAISTASTDIFIDMMINKNKEFVFNLLANYFAMINGLDYDQTHLQYLLCFKNISKQLNRIKCAKVGISAIEKIIKG